MSARLCYCPCGDWGHPGDACTGTADTALPISRTQEGNTAFPVCAACAAAIRDVSDRGTVVPPGGSL